MARPVFELQEQHTLHHYQRLERILAELYHVLGQLLAQGQPLVPHAAPQTPPPAPPPPPAAAAPAVLRNVAALLRSLLDQSAPSGGGSGPSTGGGHHHQHHRGRQHPKAADWTALGAELREVALTLHPLPRCRNSSRQPVKKKDIN